LTDTQWAKIITNHQLLTHPDVTQTNLFSTSLPTRRPPTTKPTPGAPDARLLYAASYPDTIQWKLALLGSALIG
jgi:hypothetical protein